MAIPKKLKEVFANDPEILAIIDEKEQEQLMEALSKKMDNAPKGGTDFFSRLAQSMAGEPGKTPVKGEDYMTEEEMKSLKEEILKEATPEKFKDYFTDEELTYIMHEIQEALREQVTPVKGVHYFDGEDGETPDVDAIVDAVIAKMPHDEKEELPPEEVKQRFADLEAKIPAVDAIVAEIKKGKLLELRDIKGARLDTPQFNGKDQRWHGAGLSSVSHDVSLTGDGTASNPLGIAGGGFATLGANVFTGPQSSVPGVLTSSGGLTPLDLSVSNSYTLVLTENTTLQNPINIPTGFDGINILVVQDATTPYTLSLDTDYLTLDGNPISVSTTLGAENLLTLEITTGTKVWASLATGGQA